MAPDTDRAAEILERLSAQHLDARVELDYETPLQLLIATILSAQSTDKRVNLVTPELFAKYPDAQSYADADLSELEEDVHATGFFRQKAKRLIGCGKLLLKHHDGEVPTGMEDLTALPGVGRKTANVIRAVAFGLPGIAVDTHCKRVSHRLGLAATTDPLQVENRLQELYPESSWADISRLFIWHGRYLCKARKPECRRCSLVDICPWLQAQGPETVVMR